MGYAELIERLQALPQDKPFRSRRRALGGHGRSSETTLLIGVAHSTIDLKPRTFRSSAAGYKKSAVTPNLSLIYKPIESSRPTRPISKRSNRVASPAIPSAARRGAMRKR